MLAGLSRDEWQRRGWIHPQDRLGWFHWYARFDAGRRTDDDERQIQRWREFATRWLPKTPGAIARQNLQAKGRQAILQWALIPADMTSIN